jgi:arylformamidase
MARILDISLPIGPDLLTWPGDPGVEILPAKRQEQGDPANVSELRLGSHTGTHVDPPWHFLEGTDTVDQLDPGVFYGPVTVADLGDARGAVGPPQLEALRLADGTERLLLKTANSRLWARRPLEFPDEFVSVGPEGARWLVDRGLRLVGVDFLSVEAGGRPDHPVHRTLLGAGVIIVEGLDLSQVEAGTYTLACFPLKIVDGDGAPARAVLIED